MVFHLFRVWLTKAFGSKFGSSQKTSAKSPSGGFRSIGGGGDYSRRKGGSGSTDPNTINMTFTESEERMMQDVKMQTLKTYPAPTTTPSETPSSSAIVVSNQIDITHENRSSRASDQAVQSSREVW